MLQIAEMKKIKTSTFNKVWCTFPEMIIRHLENSEAAIFKNFFFFFGKLLSTQEF